jgi:peptide deformylase
MTYLSRTFAFLMLFRPICSFSGISVWNSRAAYKNGGEISILFRRIGSPRCRVSSQSGDTLAEIDPGSVEGTELRILKYPHPALRADNADITPEELEDGSIVKIAKEMLLVMYAANGVGLAAPQVGINKRLMVYNDSGDPKRWLEETVLVNPKIVEYSPTTDIELEGCLSFPNMNGDVERSKWVKVEALSTKGKKIKKKLSGWTARVFQHEYDHLDGKVYIDRLNEESKANVQPTLSDLIQHFGPGGAL